MSLPTVPLRGSFLSGVALIRAWVETCFRAAGLILVPQSALRNCDTTVTSGAGRADEKIK